MTRPRDTQRTKLYRAEGVLKQRDQKVFESIAEMQDYVDALLDRVYDKYPLARRSIKVVGRAKLRRKAWAFSHSREIHVPATAEWARKEWILIHETAHILTPDIYAGHGWQFAKTYTELVRILMGKEAETVLKASFRKHKVRFNKPRVLTPEQKAAAAERLAKARAEVIPDPVVYRRFYRSTFTGNVTTSYIQRISSREFKETNNIRKAQVWQTGPKSKNVLADLATFKYEPVLVRNLSADETEDLQNSYYN